MRPRLSAAFGLAPYLHEETASGAILSAPCPQPARALGHLYRRGWIARLAFDPPAFCRQVTIGGHLVGPFAKSPGFPGTFAYSVFRPMAYHLTVI